MSEIATKLHPNFWIGLLIKYFQQSMLNLLKNQRTLSYISLLLFIVTNIAFILTPVINNFDADGLMQKTLRVVDLVSQQSRLAASTQQTDFSQMPNIMQTGSYIWSQQTLLLNDEKRDSKFLTDIYIPKVNHPAPVIVISNGLDEEHKHFSYLAQQLASYGFFVAVPDNNGTHLNKFLAILNSFIYGTTNTKGAKPKEFINRVLNIKFLLDELQSLSESDPSFDINLKEVGVIGHSFGGYTALALAGATLNFKQLQKDCTNIAPNIFTSSLPNVSLLLQCRALELPNVTYELQDKRIKSVMVINPVSSSIFGKSGISHIQIPVMFISSSNDIITPALMEQFLPFTWLTNTQKYLATIEGSNHFSTVGNTNLSEKSVMFLGCRYINMLGVAFFQTHLAMSKKYQSYLSPSYIQGISQKSLKLSLVNSLTATQIESAVRQETRSKMGQGSLENSIYWLIVPIYENFRDFFKT
jgi:predicted dienelactone hydrolase